MPLGVSRSYGRLGALAAILLSRVRKDFKTIFHSMANVVLSLTKRNPLFDAPGDVSGEYCLGNIGIVSDRLLFLAFEV